jgi:5-hydroxytryptamine receptor 2
LCCRWEGSGGPRWYFLGLAVALMVTGAVGNVLVWLAVCMDRALQNSTNYFLLSLAAADLLVSLCVMPLGAIPGFLGA